MTYFASPLRVAYKVVVNVWVELTGSLRIQPTSSPSICVVYMCRTANGFMMTRARESLFTLN